MTSPNTNTAAADPVQAYLDRGLRNYWYPVAPSWQVANAPIGLTRLGDQIVLWRDQEGKVHALEDRCPHRGARLSLGWNLGGSVACWYHGSKWMAAVSCRKCRPCRRVRSKGRNA